MYQNRGLELVTISLDSADDKGRSAALKFLKSEHAGTSTRIQPTLKEERRTTNNYLYASDDRNALAEALDNDWQGPVPHTLLVAPGGKVIFRHTGEIDPLALRNAIVDFLGRTY